MLHRLSQFARRTSLFPLSGILFCCLLVAFAVTSKVAAYYPHNDAARPITATKVWQQQSAAVEPVPATPATAPTLFLFVAVAAALALTTLTRAWKQTAANIEPVSRLCYRRIYGIRPPPRS